jgi:hypothetical protein
MSKAEQAGWKQGTAQANHRVKENLGLTKKKDK